MTTKEQKALAAIRSAPAKRRPRNGNRGTESARLFVFLHIGEIIAMQRRGYRIAEIASILKGAGFPMSRHTMQAYLSQARAAARGKETAPVAASIFDSRPSIFAPDFFDPARA